MLKTEGKYLTNLILLVLLLMCKGRLWTAAFQLDFQIFFHSFPCSCVPTVSKLTVVRMLHFTSHALEHLSLPTSYHSHPLLKHMNFCPPFLVPIKKTQTSVLYFQGYGVTVWWVRISFHSACFFINQSVILNYSPKNRGSIRCVHY